jgi:hypothetical protein
MPSNEEAHRSNICNDSTICHKCRSVSFPCHYGIKTVAVEEYRFWYLCIYLLGHNVLRSGGYQPTSEGTCGFHFQSRRVGWRGLLAACFMFFAYLAYPSILMIEAIYYSEKSVDFDRTTRCYVQEDRTFRSRTSLKYNMKGVISPLPLQHGDLNSAAVSLRR